MSIADFKKSYYSLFEKASPETAILNYAGLRTLLNLILPINRYKENFYSQIINANEININLPPEFNLESLKVYVNGKLLSKNVHYTINLQQKRIILNQGYKFTATLEVIEYINNTECRYDTKLSITTNSIVLPPSFNLSKLKLYINGKLLTFGSHYIINYSNKEIILIENYRAGTEITALGGVVNDI